MARLKRPQAWDDIGSPSIPFPSDPTRTRGLIPPFDAIDEHVRFPTISAFLDAIIDTMFEPIDSISHLDFRTSYLSVYNVRDEDGAIDSDIMDLLPAAKTLLEGVKAENLAYLDASMRTGSTRMTPELREERKRIKNARICELALCQMRRFLT